MRRFRPTENRVACSPSESSAAGELRRDSCADQSGLDMLRWERGIYLLKGRVVTTHEVDALKCDRVPTTAALYGRSKASRFVEDC
jgi:hypothetical protein